MAEKRAKLKDRTRALHAEWAHDYEAARVRSEKGEAAVDDSRLAEAFKNYPDPAGPPRERLIDRVWQEFHDLKLQLDPGVMVLLEAKGVDPRVREAVQEYLGDVMKNIDQIERNTVRMADRVPEPKAEKNEIDL